MEEVISIIVPPLGPEKSMNQCRFHILFDICIGEHKFYKILNEQKKTDFLWQAFAIQTR